MSNRRLNAYRLHDTFRQQLTGARSQACVLGALAGFFPVLNAKAAGFFAIERTAQRSSHGTERPVSNIKRLATLGPDPLWSRYLRLCRNNEDPLSRILRLSPHPVALSDLAAHRRLSARAGKLRALMVKHGMDDGLAIPVTDPQLNVAMLFVVGRGLNLQPTYRHLMVLVATEMVARIQQIPAIQPPPANHLKLTSRQMEIAGWLVAGKTDWEIGEILNISRKTVNYHVENVKRAYGVKTRSQFIAAIVHEGGLAPAPTQSRPPGASPASGAASGPAS